MNAQSISGKKILVTGAGGFIGSHLVELLVRNHGDVTAFVRYNSRGESGLLKFVSPEIKNEIQIIAGDLRDPNAIDMAVKGKQIVFHLGALISIPYSYKHPYEVTETNINGTLNVLTACRSHGVERLVHTSTSEVYGTAQVVPIDEKHPLQGQSPYSASKIGADKLAESFYCTFGLPVVTVRPFNTFGPRQSSRAVIPVIITQALTSSQIQLGSTHTRRDFTFVDDTVNGFLRAAIAEDVIGEVFNLGVGRDVTIGQVCEMVAARVGHLVEILVDEQRVRPEKSEVQRLLSDNRLAQMRLGWRPKVSLEDGLDKSINWIRENLDSYHVGRYEY